MSYDAIDPKKLQVFPLAERKNDLSIRTIAADPAAPPPPLPPGPIAAQIEQLAQKIRAARERGAAVMLTYGAHLIKNGAGPLLVRLLEKGWLTHLATQGAGIIHDWEFSFLGQSSESVRENACLGRFGAWDETGRSLSLAALVGAAEGLGWGEAVGKMIVEDGLTIPPTATLAQQIAAAPADPLTAARADLLHAISTFAIPAGRMVIPHPHKKYSPLAAGITHRVPFTVHPGIGYDIIINHPLFSGGAIGRAATTDARVFTHSVNNLTGGVYLSLGSAIMSPQVFEKALSSANNLRRSAHQPFIENHTIAVVDLQSGGNWDWSKGEPPKSSPAYYLRYCKSFYRMGGTLDYIQGDNRLVLAYLVRLLA